MFTLPQGKNQYHRPVLNGHLPLTLEHGATRRSLAGAALFVRRHNSHRTRWTCPASFAAGSGTDAMGHTGVLSPNPTPVDDFRRRCGRGLSYLVLIGLPRVIPGSLRRLLSVTLEGRLPCVSSTARCTLKISPDRDFCYPGILFLL